VRLDNYQPDQATYPCPKTRWRKRTRSCSPHRMINPLPTSSDQSPLSRGGLPMSFALTRDEYEALPFTIQRKVSHQNKLLDDPHKRGRRHYDKTERDGQVFN
jgi:hypothetical protein